MENLKENIKLIKKIKNESFNLKEKNKILNNKLYELYKNNEEYTKTSLEIKKNNKKIKLNDIKIAILKNNLHYLLKMDFEGIKSKMLDYYENKKISEKTKD